MKHINTIFSQLLVAIPKHRFNAVVKRYQGDKRIRNLFCWTQFCVMLYGPLCSRQSLRDVVSAWEGHGNMHYHLGVKSAKRTTLSEANGKRSSGMYLEIFYWLLGQTRDQTIKREDAHSV